MVVLWVEVQSIHFGERPIILTNRPLAEALEEGLRVLEHQLLEEPSRVDLLDIIQLGLLLGEAHIEEVLLEIADYF